MPIHKVDCLQICTLGTAALVAIHAASPFLILLTFRCLMRRRPSTRFFSHLCLCTTAYLSLVYLREVVGLFSSTEVRIDTSKL